jgi:chaperone required for assembly of F1-ATPase
MRVQIQRAKRFWKQASVIELSIVDQPAAGALLPGDDGYGVALDSRPLRAPSKQPLRLKTRALAEAVAAEWDAQEEVVNPHSMPLTQLANTAQDRMVPLRDQILAELLKHVDGDTLCYYADEPQDLLDRQHAAWTPILAWAEETYGTAWRTTCGVMPVDQSPAVHQAVATALAALSPEELAAYQVIAPVTSSVLIGLAMVAGRLTAEQAFAAASVEEIFQAELWGEDWQTTDGWDRTKADLNAAERYLVLTRAVAEAG